MNRLIVPALIIMSWLISNNSLWAYDDFFTPTRTVWNNQQSNKNFNGDVDNKIYQQQLESIAEATSDGEELETEPIFGSESDQSDHDNIQPTPTPVYDKHLKKRFSFVPETQHSNDQPSTIKLPGQDVQFEQEEITLNTAPIYEDEREKISKRNPVALSVALDRNRVHLDESFTLRVDITVLKAESLGAVRLPKLIYFELINRSQTEGKESVGGRLWHHRTINYVFLGQQPGLFKIDPIKVRYAGKTYRSKSLKIRVEGTNSGVAYRRRFSGVRYDKSKMIPGAPKTVKPDKAGVLFTGEVNQDEVFINEQVTLTIRLQYTSDERTNMLYTPPMVTGFITEPLTPINREEQISSNKQRLLDRQYRTALFPIRQGRFSIGPGRAVVTIKNKQREYLTESLVIKVKPLPKDPKPIDKKGANHLVGNYQLKASWDKAQGQVETPLKLLVTLSGTGNCRSASPPYLPINTNGRYYLEKTKETLFAKQGRIRGEKQFYFLVVFDKPGDLKFKPIQIRYFNPLIKRWQTAMTSLPPVRLESRPQLVQPSIQAQNIKLEPLQLRPNKSQPTVSQPHPVDPISRWWFWLIQLLGPIALISAFLGRRHYVNLQADVVAARIRRAYRVSQKALKQLKQWIYAGEIRKFYDGLTKITTEYLAAKFNVPTSYISADRIGDYFTAHQLPGELVGSFKVALTACEYVRYAAVTLPVRDMHALHKDLRKAINEFEQTWKRKQKEKRLAARAAMLFLLIATGSSITLAQDPNLMLTQANAAVEQGDFQRAEESLKGMINYGFIDPVVYYNLGNVQLHQGHLGEALFAYKRANWLQPRDRDIGYNLKQASRLVRIKDLEIEQPGFIRLIQKGYQFFTGKELVVATVIIYWLIIISSLWLIISPKRSLYLKKWIWLSIAMLGVMMIWSGARYSEHLWWQEAVVLVDQAPVVERPYSKAEILLRLPEGLSVSILNQEEPWVKIQIGPNHHGWVKRHILGLVK